MASNEFENRAADHIAAEIDVNVTIVRFRQDTFDRLEVEDVSAELRRLIEHAKHPMFIIDFSDVSFMSSKIFGVIMGIQLKITRQGGKLRLCNLNERIMEVFKIMRLDQVLTLDKSLESSLRDLKHL